MSMQRDFHAIHIIGDLHGDFTPILAAYQADYIHTDDLVICLGDVGVNFGGLEQREYYYKLVSHFPFCFFFIRGNHEQPPQSCPSADYEIIKTSFTLGDYYEHNTGMVYYNRKMPNAFFAMDGASYIINGDSFLTIGGANSIDKAHRKPFVSWWPNENIPASAIEMALEPKQCFNTKDLIYYDYILTHTCPYELIPFEKIPGADDSNERLLTAIYENVLFKHWFCGHWHVLKDVPIPGNGQFHFMDACLFNDEPVTFHTILPQGNGARRQFISKGLK